MWYQCPSTRQIDNQYLPFSYLVLLKFMLTPSSPIVHGLLVILMLQFICPWISCPAHGISQQFVILSFGQHWWDKITENCNSKPTDRYTTGDSATFVNWFRECSAHFLWSMGMDVLKQQIYQICSSVINFPPILMASAHDNGIMQYYVYSYP